MELRLCYAHVNNLEYDEKEGKFAGEGLSQIANFHIDVLKQPYFNLSVFGDTAYGMDRGKKHFDGCLGRLQSNESDVITSELMLPILGPGILQGPTLAADMTALLSVYNTTIQTVTTNTIEVFGAFQYSLWLFILFSLCVMFASATGILSAQDSMRVNWNKSLRVPWHRKNRSNKSLRSVRTQRRDWKEILSESGVSVLQVLAKNPDFSTKSRSLIFRFFVLLLIFFNMELFQHFESMMGVEQVLPLKPHTIESYNDITKGAGIRPVWFVSVDTHVEFESAGFGSKKRAVWDKAVSMGINDSMLRGSGEEFVNVMKGVSIIMGRERYLKGAAAYMCQITKVEEMFPKEMDPLVRVDDSEMNEFMMAVFLNAAMEKKMLDRVSKLYQRAVQNFIAEYRIRKAYIRKMNFGIKDVERCLSNRITGLDGTIDGLTFTQLRSFLFSIGAFMSFAAVVFFMETINGERRKEKIDAKVTQRQEPEK